MPNKDFQNGYALGLTVKGKVTKEVEAQPIKSATYNDDDTLDVVDKNNVTHEVVPTYDSNNKITSIMYDGESMAVTYDSEGVATKLGGIDIDGLEEYIGTGIVPSGSMNITENGTYDVTEKASAVVNVPSAELNIAYSQTAPTDTTKLWVKSSAPSSVEIANGLDIGLESASTLSAVLPKKNFAPAVASVGRKIYIFGGGYNEQYNSILVFDSNTETITTLNETLPYSACGISCVSVGTKVYLFGGMSSGSYFNNISIFDTETNEISTVQTASLSIARYLISTACVSNKIYLFGGMNGSKQNIIEIFDTETNTISASQTTLPTPSLYTCNSAIAYGDKIYIFGGDSNDGYSISINIYDTTANTISTIQTQLTYGGLVTCSNIGKNVYILNGGNGSYRSNIVYRFDIETNTISDLTTTIPVPADAQGLGRFGNRIYLFGGYNGNYLNVIEKFVVTTTVQSGDILIQEDMYAKKIELVSSSPKLNIGVSAVYKGNASNEAEVVEAYLHNGTNWVQI